MSNSTTFKDKKTGKWFRTCHGVDLELNSDNFHIRKANSHGFQNWCKACIKKDTARQRKEKGGLIERYGRAYKWGDSIVQSSRRRLPAGATYDLKVMEIVDLYKKTKKCMCGCGEKLPRLQLGIKAEFEVDHIIPLRDGGGHTINNIQLLLPKCHKTKTRIEHRVRKAKAKMVQTNEKP